LWYRGGGERGGVGGEFCRAQAIPNSEFKCQMGPACLWMGLMGPEAEGPAHHAEHSASPCERLGLLDRLGPGGRIGGDPHVQARFNQTARRPLQRLRGGGLVQIFISPQPLWSHAQSMFNQRGLEATSRAGELQVGGGARSDLATPSPPVISLGQFQPNRPGSHLQGSKNLGGTRDGESRTFLVAKQNRMGESSPKSAREGGRDLAGWKLASLNPPSIGGGGGRTFHEGRFARQNRLGESSPSASGWGGRSTGRAALGPGLFASPLGCRMTCFLLPY